MFISKSNVLNGLTPTFREGVGTDTPSNMTDPDFSVNYTLGGTRAVISFGSQSNLDYVAVCASNLGAGGQITARNGTSTATYNSVRGEYITERDHVCMFNFDRETFTDLIIVVDSNNTALIPVINYLAAGQAIQVPNGGETSGYNRNWQTRGLQSRTTTGINAAPTANLTKSVSLRGSLSLPNMTTQFTRTEWQTFLDYASSEPFFICEQEAIATNTGNYEIYRDNGGLPEASYICYEPKFVAPKAHSETRKLQNLSLRFNCYNGI